MAKIKLGLPKGSMNMTGRADTNKILGAAGLKILGYQPGQEDDLILKIADNDEVSLHLTRPQSLAIELELGLLDAGIGAEDWIEELKQQGNCKQVIKLGNLNYAKSSLFMGIPIKFDSLSSFFTQQINRDKPIVCFTEYPLITCNFICSNHGYKEVHGDLSPTVFIRGVKTGNNSKVWIVNSEGLTEAYYRMGADLIMDHTITGNTFKKYKLRESDLVMTSSAGFYMRAGCTLEQKKIIADIFNSIKIIKI